MSKTEKLRVAFFEYLDADGKALGSRACPEATALEFSFVEPTGKTDAAGKAEYVTVHSAMVTFADFPQNIREAVEAHGWKQKLADTYAGAKTAKLSPFEMFTNGCELLKAGDWVSGSKSATGPRLGMLFTALVNVLTADYGKTADEASEIAKDNVGTKEKREASMANKAVAAEYARLRAVAAAEKAAAAEQAAAEAGEEENDIFANL